MLNKKHKLLEIKTSKLVDSLFIGNYKTNHNGSGIEFADYKEYSYGDDVKNIDFIKSEQEGSILIKLFEEEKELNIYFLIELNESFGIDINKGITKNDILLEVLYLIGLSSLKSGDKIGSCYSYDNNKNLFISKKGKQNFINIINGVDNILSNKKNKNILEILKNIFNKKNEKNNRKINILKYFNNLNIKKSLVFYISDKLDFNEKDLKIISKKNDLFFINIFNSIENKLKGKGIINIKNTGYNIDLDNIDKVNLYNKLRKEKLSSLKNNIIRYGGKYLLLDEYSNIYKEFYKIFKK